MQQPDHVEQLLDTAAPLRFGKIEKRTEKVQRFLCSEILIQIRFFRQIPDLPLGFHRPGGTPQHRQLPAGGIQEPQDHFDRRGFAGTVGSQKSHHFALVDLKINIVDRPCFGSAPEVPEDLGKAHCPDYRIVCCGHNLRPSCLLNLPVLLKCQFFAGTHQPGTVENNDQCTARMQDRRRNRRHPPEDG